jgi:hypothetical protein
VSSYKDKAWNPKTNKIEDAVWLDDYFGRHQYGVKFAGDDKYYKPNEVEIPKEIP